MEEKVSCDECGYRFIDKYSLKSHFLQEHRNVPLPEALQAKEYHLRPEMILSFNNNTNTETVANSDPSTADSPNNDNNNSNPNHNISAECPPDNSAVSGSLPIPTQENRMTNQTQILQTGQTSSTINSTARTPALVTASPGIISMDTTAALTPTHFSSPPPTAKAPTRKRKRATPSKTDVDNSTNNSEVLDEKQERRIKNRKAAQLFRKRQKEHILELEVQNRQFHQRNIIIEAKLEVLTAENTLLKNQINYLRDVVVECFKPNLSEEKYAEIVAHTAA
eukprot:CAMPEP_0174272858 /NCGR_PEP_ID=MMETSP0439-20130205/52590_1 /TAXON_ID=0 /ORGANISM="Stereomyxa ramosa, Strain Chinc5" /LENGTH=278 /DNA_ID=CAMNT_0015363661 /DNA_START=26 /DNA_END=858 /DNA_ORIENTATION=+